MEGAALCQFCNQIDFDFFKNPLISDLPALSEGRVDTSRPPFQWKPRDVTPLGSFGDILQRRMTCPLCRLIADALIRHMPRRPHDEDRCVADPSFFAYYDDGRGKRYWVRRLSILVQPTRPRSTGGGLVPPGLFHAFQSCSVGAASAPAGAPFTDPQPAPDAMVFGGRRRPLVLDTRWVRRWMEICKSDHGAACERAGVESRHRLEAVRFIDVEQMCVVTLERIDLSEHRYLALSYVWAGPPTVKLERRNRDALAIQGALASKPLPRTVEDSILLAKSLGFRHLWIDALCILQDDDDDKRVQVDAMSQIYGFASLTIVAASSSGVEGGLPGLRPGTRSVVQEEIVVMPPGPGIGTDGQTDNGLSLMTTLQPLPLPGEHILERTPWNSRGWTMQERVLSRRVLVFMPEQVYWVCREATFCEEAYFEDKRLRLRRLHQIPVQLSLQPSYHWSDPDDGRLRFWSRFQSLVADYTRRTFTYQGDVFDGFRAVMQSLSAQTGEDFIWGLPRSEFESGLLWCAAAPLRRRTELSTLPMTSFRVRVSFPSWSWMGWIGEVLVWIGEARHGRAMYGGCPEILCFEHQHAPLRLEPVRRVTEPSGSEEKDKVLPKWKLSHNQPVTLKDLQAEHPLLYPDKLKQIPESHLVFFWTSSAFFSLGPPHTRVDRPLKSIVDSNGDIVGAMTWLPPRLTTITTTSNHTPFRNGSGNASIVSNARGGPHEFIVLGRRNESGHPALKEHKSLFPMLLVLQIEWRDGIAYRVGCGEIGEEAWGRAAHAWKLIALG